MSARRAFARFTAVIRKRHLESDLEDEIQAHLELAERDAVGSGLSAEEARYEARRRFGAIEQLKEQHRDRRGIAWLETLFRDFRYGLRSLFRARAFTVVVVSVLALGIGGTVAMFSVVDAALLQPLPFPDPDRIVGVWEAPRPGAVNSTTVPEFLSWKRSATFFDALAAELPISAALNDRNGPVRLLGKLVTSDYFKVFGSTTIIGRTFTREDEDAAAPLVVLSHAAWETHFGADSHILHRQISLDGETCRVIGVLRPGAFDRNETKFWKLLVFTPEERSSTMIHRLTLYGRLRAGLSLEQSRQRMQAIYTALLAARSMDEDPQGTIVIEPLSRLLVGPFLRRSVAIAFGAVFLVLLIACANVTNLLFARGATRRTEMALRASLGAGRGRLIAQLLAECLALCIFGGMAGLGVAFALVKLAMPVLSQSLPFTAEVRINWHALAFGAAAVLTVAFLTGLLPAFQASLADLSDALKQSIRGSSGTHIRIRRAIVVGEVALSMVLLCGAVLLVRSLLKLRGVETGVRIQNITTSSVSLPVQTYSTPHRAAVFYETLAGRLRSIPGVARAGLATALPLQWIRNGEGIFIPGVSKQVLVRRKRIDSGYFQTLEIPVLAGRGIRDFDREGSPNVVVINQALASRLADVAGIKNPIGKLVRLTSGDYLGKQPLISEVQIVGIVRNERTVSPGYPEPPVVYVPLSQAPTPDLKLLIQVRPRMTAPLPAIRDAVHEVDPNLPLADIASLEQIWENTHSGVRRPAWLLGSFAAIAVLLCGVGLYGVIAFSVTQRQREIGIRIALGARAQDVLSQVFRSALAMVAAGLALGLMGAYALTRVLMSLLFEVSPLDPLAFTVASVCMVLVGLVAGLVPANRAARLDPAATLRDAG